MRIQFGPHCSVIAAYTAWGILPLFWKMFSDVPPEVVLFERILWSSVGLLVLFAMRGELAPVVRRLVARNNRYTLCVSAILLGGNWLVYLWAIHQGRLAEASLGYFLCPVMSIILGVVFCGEKITKGRAFAMGCMVFGVVLRAMLFGGVPWIAIAVAGTFSVYSLVRKRSTVSAAEGLLFETGVMLPFAALLLMRSGEFSTAVILGRSWGQLTLFVTTGVVTAVPLLWLISGAQKVSMQFLGAAQYLAPTFSLLIAVLVYGEPFTSRDAVSFLAIWIGVLLLIVTSLRGRSGANGRRGKPFPSLARGGRLRAGTVTAIPVRCRRPLSRRTLFGNRGTTAEFRRPLPSPGRLPSPNYRLIK